MQEPQLRTHPLQLRNIFLTKLNAQRFELAEESSEREFNYNISPRLDWSWTDDKFVIYLNLAINFTDEKNKPFELELRIAGEFDKVGDFPEDQIEPFVKQSGLHLLWPYARSYISITTNMIGVSSLVLPTLNIGAMITEEIAGKPESPKTGKTKVSSKAHS